MDSRRRLRAWFRDDDGGWQFPEGRRGEFVALLVGLPSSPSSYRAIRDCPARSSTGR